MITASLTDRRVPLEDGSSAFQYPWNGETVLVNDSAANGVSLVKLFLDKNVGEMEKSARVVGLMFADPEDAFCACDFSIDSFGMLVREVAWDVFGINAGGHRDERPLWDIEQDAAMIRASLRQAYGIDWDSARDSISWHEFLVLVGCLPYETPLGRAMYYRNPRNRPERGRHNGAQVAEFDRLHALYALKNNGMEGSHEDRIEGQQHAMDNMALAFRSKMER